MERTIPQMPSSKIVLQMAGSSTCCFPGILLGDAPNGLHLQPKHCVPLPLLKAAWHMPLKSVRNQKHQLQVQEVPITVANTPRLFPAEGQSAFDSIKILFDLVLPNFSDEQYSTGFTDRGSNFIGFTLCRLKKGCWISCSCALLATAMVFIIWPDMTHQAGEVPRRCWPLAPIWYYFTSVS